MPIHGIHHVTTIASDPQKNLDFYSGVLGLRLVKKTVNFDDPATYHLYYGDDLGRPGTAITFFPWPGAVRGNHGSGQTSATAFSVPSGALGYWRYRLQKLGVTVGEESERLGERVLALEDHDGTKIELIELAGASEYPYWEKGGVQGAHAIRGFRAVTLSVEGYESTARLLTGTFGMRAREPGATAGAEHGNRFRYEFERPGKVGDGQVFLAQYIDVVCTPDLARGRLGAGIVHHVALRAADDADQVEWRATLASERYNVTPVVDRTYFHSIYFREPGGVLLEIATNRPGFTVDEAAEHLGEALKLPPQHEKIRAGIERHLKPLKMPTVFA